MKRFLLIFAICLSAVVGVVAGIYGIKYLKGDFDPVVITPENIRFDLGNETEYNVCDNFTAKIISDTEGVTVDEVELDFVIDTSVGESVKIPYKKLKDKIQYSAVTIPKTVKIGEEFEIIVNKSYNEELGEDWIVGGNVTISATAVSNTAVYKTVDINVDVPVKSAELVVVSGFNEISESTNFSSLMKNIESSEIAKPLSEIADDNSPFVYAGDEFYLGVKYSPAESAFKYSKISSTNLFIEYETEIKEQAKNYGLEAEVNALLDYVNSGTNVQATYLFELYEKVISENINNTQFVNYIKSLNEKFTSNLKYITIENEILNEISYVNKFDRVYGTNLFKYNATNNTEGWDKSVNSKLYAYITTDAKSEEKFFEDFNSSDEVRLRELEKDSKRETPIYNIKKINSEVKVVDVEIDAINILGSVQSFKTHQIYNLFALKDGTNNEYNSYLKLDLSNDNIDIDLSKKVQNVAITFEMKTGTNTWSYAKDIQVIDAQQVNVAGTENIYYKPTINGSDYKNAYWKIYSDVYITNEVRTKVVYLNNDETINNNIVIDEKTYPSFNLEDATLTEENVSWNDISNLDIGTLHLTGVMNETDGKVVVKKEIDLSKLVNVPKANNFQQYKFFLYTKDEVDLNNYFYLKDKESKTYLIDGEYFKLFELDGENLKLKNDDISNLTSDVYVMFATVKTSALGYAITTNGLYEFIKYSIALDGGNNVLSSLKLQFNKYISGIEGVIFNVTCEDENSAGIIESVSGEELKLAQNKTDIAKISLSLHPTANDATKENFKQILDAMLKEKITLVAYNANTQELIEIINANPFVSGENAYFVISTKEVIQDANIFFAIKYIVDEKNVFYFKVDLAEISNKMIDDPNNAGKKIESDEDLITIVKDITPKVTYNFWTDITDGDVLVISKTISLNASNEVVVDTAYYKNEIQNSNKIIETILLADSLNIVINDFLGNEKTNWKLVSSDENIVKINENKKFSVISTGEVLIQIYVDGFNTAVSSFKIKVEAINGYVSQVIANGKKIGEYNDTDNKYNFDTISIALECGEGSFTVSDLIKISYKYKEMENGVVKEEKPIEELPLTIYVDSSNNADILSKFNVESGEQVRALTIPKIYSTISITLLYKFEDLDLVQKVTLNFYPNQKIKTETLKVEFDGVKAGNTPILISPNSSNVYNIYSGIKYTVSFETEITETIFAYWDKDTEYFTEVKYSNGKHSFEIYLDENITGNKEIILHNTNDKTNVTAGSLTHKILVKATKSIALKDNYEKNYVLSGNSVTVDFEDLFTRNVSFVGVNNEKLNLDDFIKFKSSNLKTNSAIISISENKLTITPSAFTNTTTITFNVSSNGTKLFTNDISLNLYPENIATSYSNIAMYNGEKAFIINNEYKFIVENIKANFDSLKLASSDSIVWDTGFNSSYIEDNEIIYSGSDNGLFVDTGFYLSVKDNNNFVTKYKLIHSKLPVQLLSLNKEYENIDIYKLYDLGNKNISQKYYEDNDLFFVPVSNQINLLDVVNNDAVVTGISESEVIKGDVSPNNFISYENGILKFSPVGAEHIVKIILKVSNKGATNYYLVPILVKIEATQTLNVQYEFGGLASDFVDEYSYASDEYDNDYMFGNFDYFATDLFDFQNFDSNGKFELDLTLKNNSFIVNPTGYNLGFKFEVEKLTIYSNGEWKAVNDADIENYVTITDDILSAQKNNLDALRIKLKVSTIQQAVNYYYISVGESYLSSFRLIKKVSNGNYNVGAKDTITVSTAQTITIGTDAEVGTTNVVSYYISNEEFSHNLKFRILEDDSVNTIDYTNKTITVGQYPNGGTFVVQIYNVYGVISTVTVNVNKSFELSLKETNIYSDNEYAVSDLFNITNTHNYDYEISILDGEENLIITDDKIKFNSVSAQKLINLAINVTINEKTFVVDFGNITVNPRITSTTGTLSIDLQIGTVQISGNNTTGVVIDESLKIIVDNNGTPQEVKFVESLFVDNYSNSSYNVAENTLQYTIILKVGNTNINLDSKKFTYEVLDILGETTTQARVMIYSGEVLVATREFTLTIKPLYDVQLNYPTVWDASGKELPLEYEIIKKGSEVDITAVNLNGVERVTATDKDGNSQTITYKVGGSAITKYTFNSDTNVDVYIGEVKIATYKVKVQNDSPISVESNGMPTIYVGEGDSNLLLADATKEELESYTMSDFAPRFILKYNGYNIRYCDYANIFETININSKAEFDLKDENGKSLLEKIYKLEKIKNKVDGSEHEFEFNYKFNINVTINEVNLVANESSGYDFKQLFGITSLTGTDLTGVFDVTVQKDSLSVLDIVEVTPITEGENTEVKVINYTVKALGAKNEGSTAKLMCTYEIAGKEYMFVLTINVKTDLVAYTCSEENVMNENSESNPYIVLSGVSAGESFVLADETKKAFIHIYSKFDLDQNNLAHLMNVSVTGETEYINAYREGGKIYLRKIKDSVFGNRSIKIVLKDEYGFTVNYYITMNGNSSVDGVELTSGSVYESNELNVYNKHNKDANEKGIALDIKTSNGKNNDTETSVIISEARFYHNGKELTDFVKISTDQKQIKFNYFNNYEGVFDYKKALSIQGTLEIVVKNKIETSGEVQDSYTIILESFAVNKKYKVEIKPENTFVRDDDTIYLYHYVDVYDYQQKLEFGKVTLSNNEMLKLQKDISDIEINAENGINTANLVLDKGGKTNVLAVYEAIKATSDTNLADLEILNNLLAKVGIYSATDESSTEGIGYEIILKINAQNRATSKIISTRQLFKLYAETDGTKVTSIKILDEKCISGSEPIFESNIVYSEYNFSFEYIEIKTDDEQIFEEFKELSVSIDNLEKTNKYSLTVSSYTDKSEATIYLKDSSNTYGYKLDITAGNHIYYLSNTIVTDINLKDNLTLYSGLIEGKRIINGIDADTAKVLKGISKIVDENGVDTTTYNAELTSEVTSYNSTYNVRYNSNQVTLQVQLESEYTMASDYNINVTNKFTGVDSSEAYGTTNMHYVYYEFDSSNLEDNKIKNNIDFALNVWSQGFKLIPGVGLSNIFASYDDLTFGGNAGVITFTVEKQNELFDISADGKITLKSGFAINYTYIPVNVICNYATEKTITIATVYVSFVNVTNVSTVNLTVNVDNTTNPTKINAYQATINIENYVDSNTTKNNVIVSSGELENVGYNYNATSKLLTITADELIDGKVILLETNKASVYLKINLESNKIQLTGTLATLINKEGVELKSVELENVYTSRNLSGLPTEEFIVINESGVYSLYKINEASIKFTEKTDNTATEGGETIVISSTYKFVYNNKFFSADLYNLIDKSGINISTSGEITTIEITINTTANQEITCNNVKYILIFE